MKKPYLPVCAPLLALWLSAACTTAPQSPAAGQFSAAQPAAAAPTLKKPATAYLTDREIEAVQTIGDYKNAFNALIRAYLAEFDEWIAKQPPHIREGFKPYRKRLSTDIEKHKADLSAYLAGFGDDGTAVPKAMRDSLKDIRDDFKATMADVISEAESLFGQQ